MKKYKYTLKTPLNTTILVEGREQDISLSKDEESELPENHPFTKQLIAQGALVPVGVELEPKQNGKAGK